ncbi:MAG: hypothetical protein ACREIA_11025 [Opitutaceae bacterium]
MHAPSLQALSGDVRASLFHGSSPRRCMVRWVLVCAVIVVWAEETDGASEATAAESAEWRVSTPDGEIRGLADGTRLVRRGESEAVMVEPEANMLKTSDGVVYRATAESLVIVPKAASGARDEDEPARSLFEKARNFLMLDRVEEDAEAQRWMFWGGVALQMALRTFCIAIVFQVFCYWIGVSYSKAVMLRFAVLFVLAGELIIRVVPAALRAG